MVANALVVDEWFRAIVCIIRFRGQKWQEVEVTQLSAEASS
ncbi:hypothetical protein [Halonatronum saccharophilum]|nr:hypothetical protein [Halonatronum saccharophilum]